jgi:hypothetical protein
MDILLCDQLTVPKLNSPYFCCQRGEGCSTGRHPSGRASSCMRKRDILPAEMLQVYHQGHERDAAQL